MSRKEALLALQEVLIKRRDALRKALAGDLTALKELRIRDNDESGFMDAALEAAQDEISSQLVEVEDRELARIENALLRVREGKYGICENEKCGASIPMARLNALPYATLCIKCQREAECSSATGPDKVDWTRLLDPPNDSDQPDDFTLPAD